MNKEKGLEGSLNTKIVFDTESIYAKENHFSMYDHAGRDEQGDFS